MPFQCKLGTEQIEPKNGKNLFRTGTFMYLGEHRDFVEMIGLLPREPARTV